MKILDVIENKTTITFESRKEIFEDETPNTRTPPAGTDVELDGRTYRWRGNSWAEVVNGTVRAQSQPREMATRLTAQWRSANPAPRVPNPRLQFLVGEIYPVDGPAGRTWGVGLGGNSYIAFESVGSTSGRDAAQNFINGLEEGERNNADRMRRRVPATQIRESTGFRRLTQRLAEKGSISQFNALGNLPRIGPSLQQLLQSPVAAGVFRIISAAGIGITAYLSMWEVINDLEIEAQQNPDLEEENYQLRNIVIAQVHVQIGLVLYQIMKTTSLFNRALRAIKWTVRSVQGGLALTGVGTLPSLLSLIVTEAGWLVAGFIISSPAVQLALAEWLRDTMFGQIIVEPLGRGISGAYQILDTALDGAFGTDAMRRNLGWDNDQEEAADGEMITNSEWAKLVFHGLLFPPGAEKHLVPYINPNERTRLLQERLGVTVTDSEQPAPGETTPPQEPVVANIGGQDLTQDDLDAAREVAGSAVDAVPAQEQPPAGNPSGATSWETMTPQDFQVMANSGNFGG